MRNEIQQKGYRAEVWQVVLEEGGGEIGMEVCRAGDVFMNTKAPIDREKKVA